MSFVCGKRSSADPETGARILSLLRKQCMGMAFFPNMRRTVTAPKGWNRSWINSASTIFVSVIPLLCKIGIH